MFYSSECVKLERMVWGFLRWLRCQCVFHRAAVHAPDTLRFELILVLAFDVLPGGVYLTDTSCQCAYLTEC